MEPSVVEAALADRAARLRRQLVGRWGSVPHSRRRLPAGGYDVPASPDEVFPHVAVCFVVERSVEETAESVRVLVCRDDAHETLTWEPPGGKGRPAERPVETAVREVKEETGLAVAVRDLIATECLQFDYGEAMMPVLQAVFVAEREAGSLDSEPAIEPAWFSAGALPGETLYRKALLDYLDRT